MAHQELGVKLLKRVEKDLEELWHCRAVSENGRAAAGHGYGAQKEVAAEKLLIGFACFSFIKK